MGQKIIRDSLNAILLKHLGNVGLANKVIKGFLLIGGSLVAGIAQFSDIPDAGIENSQVAGIAGSIAVFCAALWSLLAERDATDELRVALQATQEAETATQEIDELRHLYDDIGRAANLMVGVEIMRGYLEHLFDQASHATEEQIVTALLENAGRFLALSMDLSGDNEWTLCAYRAEPVDGGRDVLKLVGHHRAIMCGTDDARQWEEGVGVAGICYSTEQEVIVPDFQSEGVGSLFNVGERERDYDASRYQSIIAVPIKASYLTRPWGVVTATSDRRFHFTPDEPGVQRAEGARVLAGNIALAVSIRQSLAR